ncbi:hypothetical protein FXW30_03805 [Candidatus Liberibacter asiaticus]|uniref:Uncharacterized protein n=1 Tax=Candidatus Liberibacter asiaticus str. gxpsy TaxID=1174529 RepID=A0ABM5NGE0_LIBAS|nr:hypothetical protein WSI_03820 [Candidatus Liberibacter asiaticus str. gxpsy]KAE9509915.1 hypothetical protein FXW22_03860 [Candidatus Liberibacter asiaticus]BAP26660.1 hypothetical protein CGUJ_03977 [Candidatus Liberibacter asiaticus str. Ishi-1]KAE9510703.1 hypothetical protein FXW31_05390 [Candidatus Liberibacter asiaticus]KAE9512048.1 hypothetical protein FXW32_03775 [Candidatus Liberibacter asiaticus]
MSKAPSKDSHLDYIGHHNRLRDRFLQKGENALAYYEILELILFRLIPRKDTKSIAKALLKRFATLGGVFGAPLHLLQEINRIGKRVALELKLVSVASQRILKANWSIKKFLTPGQPCLISVERHYPMKNANNFAYCFSINIIF